MNIIKPVYILDVPVHPYTMNGAVELLNEKIIAKEQTFIVTANAEIIMMCQKDFDYKAVVAQKADLVLPDGAGAVWAGRKLGYQVPERVAGFDLFNELLKLASEKGYKAFFFGGSPGIAESAAEKAKELNPGVQIVGCRNGYFNDDEAESIIEEINASGAELLFVALGAPKQEKWLADFRDKLKPTILMGIGGSFDVLAGKMERAPLWMQKSSLEWLFRLYKQPSRIGRMSVLPIFVLKVLQRKLK